MTNLPCFEFPVDKSHKGLVILRNDVYEFYILQFDKSAETPFTFVYGLPADGLTFDDCEGILKENAPMYYDFVDDKG